ncbi:hypothetical protein QJS66_02000 [Kocuria rhizophila]|nr:hypothetical protein QJS66_02000 [Kocuria rhizophila]
MDNENLQKHSRTRNEIGYEKIIDTYAAATQHVDQGLSLTLSSKDTATTLTSTAADNLRAAQGHQDHVRLGHPPAPRWEGT